MADGATPRVVTLHLILSTSLFALVASSARAQDRPYFVTADHYLEQPRGLDVAVNSTVGFPRQGHERYAAPWVELEYGITEWWTTALYLEGVTTTRDGRLTGWRTEHRIRPLKRNDHALNPILYLEYARVSEASRIQKDIVGGGPLSFEPIRDLRQNVHEIETKLIVSSPIHAWNVAENLSVEKNLSSRNGYELGYSIGISRMLVGVVTPSPCRLCKQRFVAGVEAYGGLGTTEQLGMRGARHFIAPVVLWRLSERAVVKASVAVGLTAASDRVLVRLGWAYDFGEN